MNAVNSPKSTSASVPGRWVWGTITSTPFRPSSTRRRATYRDTVTSAHASIAGLTRRAYGLRGGGTALTNAARTARRCTRCRSASSRIDSPSTRRSRRIRSNSSTRDRTPADPPADRNGQEDHKQGGANIRADTPTPPPDSAPTRWGQISRRFRPPPWPDQVNTLITHNWSETAGTFEHLAARHSHEHDHASVTHAHVPHVDFDAEHAGEAHVHDHDQPV